MSLYGGGRRFENAVFLVLRIKDGAESLGIQAASAAAAAAKSLQSCPTLCDPMDSSPPGSSVHGILQARILDYPISLYDVHHTPGHIDSKL